NVKTLEGKPLDTTLIALLQFPSAEAAEAFVTDPEYAPYAAARQGGSDSRFQLIDDTDLAGTIPYLPKGGLVRVSKASACKLDLVHVRPTCNAKLPAPAARRRHQQRARHGEQGAHGIVVHVHLGDAHGPDGQQPHH